MTVIKHHGDINWSNDLVNLNIYKIIEERNT